MNNHRNPAQRALTHGMRHFVSLMLASLVAFSPSAWADVVTDWYGLIPKALANSPRAQSARAQLLAAVAMFNALNAVTPRYQPYAPAPDAVADASADIAAMTAAWIVLGSVPGADHALLDKTYDEAFKKVAASDARKKGVVLGKRVAYMLLAARADDNFERVDASKDEFAVGVFQQAADRKIGINIAVTFRRPYGVASMAAFDPGTPPKPDSAVALRDVAEVKALAARMSTTRTADQTAAALFWNSGEDSDALALFERIAEARKLDALDHARMMALSEIADADLRQAFLTFKNKYRHWRPDAAITSKFAHASVRDETWEPLIHTPGDSDYPSGGASGAGFFMAFLTHFNGDNVAKLSWKNTSLNVTRTWPNAQAMSTELANSRVWGGAHFRTSVDAGFALGKRVTEEVLATQLKPLAAK